MRRALSFVVIASIACATVPPPKAGLPTIGSKTGSMERRDGFVPTYWDAASGKLWLEIARFDQPFIYQGSLPHGVGSNDIGLDRGQLGRTRLVRFMRRGPRVLLSQDNLRYRAETDNAAERQSVTQAFASSVLWGFEVAAESDGRVLVDATTFFLRDAHGVAKRLASTKQGSFRFDAKRSAIDLAFTRGFPKNTEVQAIVTLVAANGKVGDWASSVTPSADAITVRQRHSFIALPDDGYQPRTADPRAGLFALGYRDYATPIGAPMDRHLVYRHRLAKRDPSAAVSEAVEPIVYHVDSGAPEPVRSALLDGARWWATAFEKLGYRDAFRVEVLPADADPMDVRYNVIQWVHRSTRGWSYGDWVADPRTGEIIKGHVTLGSLRVRHDYLIASGLLGGDGAKEMEAMALARLRQLAAHEVGHTLGVAHNFAASANDRASVMDYPHPLVTLKTDGTLDLTDAYGVGVGRWDEVAIAYAYQQFEGDEGEALQSILREASAAGLLYISDRDARPSGGAHPSGHLWDNGADPVAELERVMKVRSRALAGFSEKVIGSGRARATIEDALVPMYLFHRYQVEAAIKQIGGVHFRYSVRGDGSPPMQAVSEAKQRAALDAVLATVSDEALRLRPELLALIPPRPPTVAVPRRELFGRRSGLIDPMAAASAASNHVLGLLLHRDRAARLVDAPLSLQAVIGRVLDLTWRAPKPTAVDRAVAQVAMHRLMSLARDRGAAAQVRAVVGAALTDLEGQLARLKAANPSHHAHLYFGREQLRRSREDPAQLPPAPPGVMPAGSPIGLEAPRGCGNAGPRNGS